MSKGTMHRVSILGRLGTDPDIKALKEESIVAKLNVATSERIKRKDSTEWEEVTTWHHVTAFGKMAEFCKSYLHKGDTVYVEAKLKPSKWEDKDGNERYTLDIVATELQQTGKLSRADEEEGKGPLKDVQ